MNNNFQNFNNFSFNSQIFKKSYVNKIINNDNNLLETGFKINQYNDENYLNKQIENLIKINKEIIKEIRKQNYEKAIQFITNNISILKNFPKKKTITTIQE
jgi:predicted metal-dependent hydrolase